MGNNDNLINCYKSLSDACIRLNNLKQKRSDLYLAKKELVNFCFYETIHKNREKLINNVKDCKKVFVTFIPFKIVVTLIIQLILFYIIFLVTGSDLNIGSIIGTTIGLNVIDVIKARKKYKNAKKELKYFNENMEILTTYEDLELSELLTKAHEIDRELEKETQELRKEIEEYTKYLEEAEKEYIEDILKQYEIDAKIQLGINYKSLKKNTWEHNKRFGNGD